MGKYGGIRAWLDSLTNIINEWPHCSLCDLEFLRGFTASGSLGVILGELGLCVELESLPGSVSMPHK